MFFKVVSANPSRQRRVQKGDLREGDVGIVLQKVLDVDERLGLLEKAFLQ